MQTLRLRVYAKQKAEYEVPITKLVFPKTSPKAVIHTDRFFGIRILTRKPMKKVSVLPIPDVTQITA